MVSHAKSARNFPDVPSSGGNLFAPLAIFRAVAIKFTVAVSHGVIAMFV